MEYEVVENEGIECFSPKDVAKLLSISKPESYRIFNSKDFPSFKLGEKLLRITKFDFNIWLQKQKSKNT